MIGNFTKVQFQGYETLIVRFDENGMLDEHFGDSGRINFDAAGDVVLLNCESNDFMLLGGIESERKEIGENVNVTTTGYYISKYDYYGNLDENFGDTGKAHLPKGLCPGAVKTLNDGSIAVAGAYNCLSDDELGLCKLTPAGQLDTVFANDGIWHWNTMPVFDLSYEGFCGNLEDSSGNLILSVRDYIQMSPVGKILTFYAISLPREYRTPILVETVFIGLIFWKSPVNYSK